MCSCRNVVIQKNVKYMYTYNAVSQLETYAKNISGRVFTF